jgi:hypothetical protein
MPIWWGCIGQKAAKSISSNQIREDYILVPMVLEGLSKKYSYPRALALWRII